MKSDTQLMREFMQIVLPGIVCSIILGFLFFQSNVLQWSHYAFGFVVFGLIGSIAFGAFRMLSPSRGWATLLLVFVLLEVLAKPGETYLFLRDVLFTMGMGTAIYVFHRLFYTRLANVWTARPLVLASLVAVSATIVTIVQNLLLVAFYRPPAFDLLSAMSINLMIGFLVGIGLGVGFEIGAKINARVFNYTNASNANGG